MEASAGEPETAAESSIVTAIKKVQQAHQQLEQEFQQLYQQLDQLQQELLQQELLEQKSQQIEQVYQQLKQKLHQLDPAYQQLMQKLQQLQQELLEQGNQQLGPKSQQQEQRVKQLKQQIEQQLTQLDQQMNSIIAGSYRQAVITGEHAAHQFKLVMLGPEGGGKTSTVYSLLGKDFQPHQPSTVGADVSNTCTADRHCVTDWKLKVLDHHLQDIFIHYKYELYEAMSESIEDVFEEESVKSEECDIVAGRDILLNKMTPEGKIRIVIYDLGGQEVYYEIHFLFLASHDTVFLTFDASKKLDAPVVRRQRYTISQEVYKTKKTQTNYEVIETTLQAIYSHCGIEGNKDSLSPRIPTVVMVGTHAFNLTIDEKEVISKMLIRRLRNKPLFDHLPRNAEDAIHFIDNKERDLEAINHLKAVAIKAAQFAITEMRPIPYLKFEKNILEISQKETEISIEKACGVAFKAGLDNSPESLLALLQYYTFKGVLLYYPDIGELKNWVFISPQQVSNLVSCVIKTHDYAEPMPNFMLQRKFDRFDKFGILEEYLLDYMLERSNYAKNIVLGFLEHFDLAVEVDRRTTFENEDDTYRPSDTGRVFFVPSMLVYNEKEKYIKPLGHIDNVMLYHFPDKFLPENVFNHVLISTIRWCQNNGHHICRYVHS